MANRPDTLNRRLSMNSLIQVGNDATERAKVFCDNILKSKYSDDENDEPQTSNVMNLSWSNLSIGKGLGNGNFADVCNTKLRLGSSKKKLIEEDSSPQKYAVKKLRRDTLKQKSMLKIGAVDLYMEATILEHLQHENIIRILGKKGGNLEDSLIQGQGYFLVMEQLFDTLDKRIIKWKKSEKKISPFRKFRAEQNISSDRVVNRLEEAALGIAQGMEYMHSKNILFRDLKPDNIGFCSDDKVKIFDFGLARQIDPDDNDRHMTGQCGTMRYMAPENAKCQSYGLPADVYSFGLVLWEICQLQQPYSKIKGTKEFSDKVFMKNLRPPLRGFDKNDMSLKLKSLISECWDGEQILRPAFPRVVQQIQNEINAADAIVQEDDMVCSSSHSNKTILDFRKKNSVHDQDERFAKNLSDRSHRNKTVKLNIFQKVEVNGIRLYNK